jgi:hypothetical protein
MLAQVPAARVHESLGAFADHLLARHDRGDSTSGGLG